MADLSTTYLGLKLKSPIIVGANNLTHSVDKIKEFAAAGAGAVVLKSLFEEELVAEVDRASDELDDSEYGAHTDAYDFVRATRANQFLADYVSLIKKAKAEAGIPIIASVNCNSAGKWVEFAKTIEDAGADALEVNVFLLPADKQASGRDLEKTYIDLAKKLKQTIRIPVALKIGPYFTALASLMHDLQFAGVDGLVLFNRFYRPDIDIDRVKLKASNPLSVPEESGPVLRWMALMSGELRMDLSATTGVHDGEGLVKMLLVGAKSVQTVSAVIKGGADAIKDMNGFLTRWMDEKGYGTIADFNGLLCQERSEEPGEYERSQYLRALRGR